MKAKFAFFERVLNIVAALCSIFGVSAVAVFTIINTYSEIANQIGLKILLSVGAVFGAVFLTLLIAYPLQVLIKGSFDVKSMTEEEIAKLSIFYFSVIGFCAVAAFVGIMLMIWTHNFAIK
ncbi:hypothetical protein EDM57_04885 [Brevibacillus gelatini]|uniref:Uncharacterized protein n=1 Tax=Brevibacillus gelatini TaxID=1655277 RepID=A0A3M8B7Z3_9BACL|nr:hypothetical protein [Brevibacillus gelatini]RNB59480.1 hypothetical protein EDM57_04885 [Brevibacillus gelatini]